ncbi:MAG: hypothetical protein FJW69_08570 [Actinobacteria bacterium]|nr:hypothetical protein [Actinomycetota bacterium]
MERLPNNKTQEKLAKVFKAVISAGLVAPVFVSASACKKTDVIVEEETPTTTIQETTPPTTAEETIPIVTETTPETIKEVDAPEIEGLKFNQETREYLNKEGEVVGVYVKDAFEFNGEMQDAIGLVPKEIERLQKKLYEETKEYPGPILFNLQEVKGLKINELKVNSGFLAGVTSLGMNVPPGSVFYSPLSGEWNYTFTKYFTKSKTNDKSFYKFYQSGPNADGQYYMDFNEGEIIANLKERSNAINGETGEEIPIDLYELKLGDPVGVINGTAFLDETSNRVEDQGYFYENPGEYQFCLMNFISNKDGTLKSVKILEASNKNIKIFILPDKSAHEQIN